MIFKAVVSSKAHPEYGQAAISFPIPDDQYDSIIKLLEAMDIGSPILQDCRVDEISSGYPILDRLVGQDVNVDELDFVGASFISLASASGESSLISLLLLPKSKPLRWVSIWLPLKRLESFCHSEAAQFQAMAFKLSLSDIKDYINLTFCSQQATVITDFSDLEQVGKDHSLTINGGSMPMEEFEQVDGLAVALDLIQSSAGIVTPYGVVFDNGMRLEQLYTGGPFPQYLHGDPLLTLGVPIQPEIDGPVETAWLYLPAPEQQISRTLGRIGIINQDAAYFIEDSTLPPKIFKILERPDDAIPDLNRLCQTVSGLDDVELKKLEAVVLMAQPTSAGEIHQLAENLDQFDFVSKPDSPVADSALTELGYVACHGSLTLEELLTDGSAEQHQWEQGMGGI